MFTIYATELTCDFLDREKTKKTFAKLLCIINIFFSSENCHVGQISHCSKSCLKNSNLD